MTENKITVDFLEQINIDKSLYKQQVEMLGHLRAGLENLYTKCKAVENKIQHENECYVQAQTFSLLFYSSSEFYDALPCYFHWFSVTAINYARLIGYFYGIHKGDIDATKSNLSKQEQKKIKGICSNYVKSITELKPVEVYRNKVAAHFAVTDPYSDDNFVTMNFSAINLAGLCDSRLVSKAEMTLIQDKNGQLVADDIPIWSLTKVFEDLSSRFWPDYTIPTIISGESFFEKNEREKTQNDTQIDKGNINAN